jgi:palmitoyltransferase
VAYYFAKRRREDNFVNVHWILVLVLAALFFFFAAGMCGSSLQMAFVNTTTIENFTRKTKVWYLAVYVPTRMLERYNSLGRNDLRFITYPRPPSEQFQVLRQHGANLNESEQNVATEGLESNVPAAPPAAYPSHPGSDMIPAPPVTHVDTHPLQPQPSRPSSHTLPVATSAVGEPRTFAILDTAPGANPFHVGPFNNFKEVMGYTFFDWLVPIRPSPLVDHRDPGSMYKLGPVVKRLRQKAGIDATDAGNDESGYEEGRKTRRRRRKSSTQNRAGTLPG